MCQMEDVRYIEIFRDDTPNPVYMAYEIDARGDRTQVTEILKLSLNESADSRLSWMRPLRWIQEGWMAEAEALAPGYKCACGYRAISFEDIRAHVGLDGA